MIVAGSFKKNKKVCQKLNPAEICFGTLATEYKDPRSAHSATNQGALDARAMTAASCRFLMQNPIISIIILGDLSSPTMP